jgi:hypothetical protein
MKVALADKVSAPVRAATERKYFNDFMMVYVRIWAGSKGQAT